MLWAALALRIDQYLAMQRPNWPAWLAVAIGSGIAIYFALPIEPAPWLGVLGFVGLGMPAWLLRRRPLALIVVAALAAVTLGFAAAQLRTALLRAPQLDREIRFADLTGEVAAIELLPVGERVTLRNVVVTELPPTRTPTRVRIKLVKMDEAIAVGDRIRVTADLQPPAPPAAPGAFDFRRQAYFMQLGGVGFAFGAPEIIAKSPGGLIGALDRLRQAIAHRILEVLPGPGGAVALALVVGDQTALTKVDAQAMRDSGLAHLLSISGLHIGLAAGLFFFLVRGGLALIPPIALRFPIKKWAAVMALFGAVFYALLAGFTAPTERSLLMTGIVFLAILLDRSPFSIRSIAWAAIVILLIQPDLLVGASFQMSFFAVLGLIAAFEALREPMLSWRRARRDAPDLVGRAIRSAEGAAFWLGGVMATSFVATLMTAPFSIYHFNRLASYGVVANMIAVPLTGFWVMPAGVAALVMMPLGLDAPFWQIMGLGCDAILWIAERVASWPGAVVIVPGIPVIGLAVTSFGLLWLCLLRGSLRFLALLPILGGFAGIALTKTPDLLVADSAKLVAVKDPAGNYRLSSNRAEKQTAETWLRRNGQGEAGSFEREAGSADDTLDCDALGCIYRRHGRAVSIVFAGDALAEDCRSSDAIVSLEPVRHACDQAKLVIDRFDIFDNGAYALWIDDQGTISAESVAQSLGTRPWVMRRGLGSGDESPPDNDTAADAAAAVERSGVQ